MKEPVFYCQLDYAHVKFPAPESGFGDLAKGCLGIISKTITVCHSGCKSNYVFKGCSNLDPQHIRAYINPEYFIHKDVLNLNSSISAESTNNYSCWHVLANFLCVRRS